MTQNGEKNNSTYIRSFHKLTEFVAQTVDTQLTAKSKIMSHILFPKAGIKLMNYKLFRKTNFLLSNFSKMLL